MSLKIARSSSKYPRAHEGDNESLLVDQGIDVSLCTTQFILVTPVVLL